ncbi:IS1 family transposase [Granulicella sp. WH15]|uniref:IS1 family transposase n=1 Tax=Granulicella sp. WH15 TaxID=2602070 RepID=UPI0013668D0E|nr:IS1 family transposase [Granulicella sp. WH15]QHN03496.1 IS1 family transposase [Granulicella sp. WH15]
MNRLPIVKRARIIQMLAEGSSLRATSRMADVSINTVTKLLVDVAEAAYEYHDKAVRDVRCNRVQADEIWCFVGAKAKNVLASRERESWGDVWTWVALDSDSKLCVSYLVGGRDGWWATEFMRDVAARIRGRVQLTTDGHRAYLNAVEDAFGMDVDYAQLQKIYRASNEPERRYSPAQCIGFDMKTVSGHPDPNRVTTGFVERQNLTMRMSMRRLTCVTNAFSKKVENHAAAVALHFIHYNFARIHKTLRITPAMAAGISDHVWSHEEIAALAN